MKAYNNQRHGKMDSPQKTKGLPEWVKPFSNYAVSYMI
jgi:hypothetical protein